MRSSLFGQCLGCLSPSSWTHIKAAAERMDQILWDVLELAASSNIPRAGEGRSWECLVDVPGLESRSYQDWVVMQPVRLGGMGLRSQADLSSAAFLGALEQTLPSFVGERGVCPQLAHLVGDSRDTNQRWAPLLESGCKSGPELAKAWESIQREARGMTEFLGQEMEGASSVEVTGVGS